MRRVTSLAQDERPPVVVLTGPTASGKTAAALRLAKRFDAEIVSADSMQVYRYLDIGTAKPSLAERAQAPHHLLDVVLPDVEYNAGRYAREARSAAGAIHGRDRLVLLVGGTGLYIRAFLEGLLDQGGADAKLREGYEREHAQAVESGDPELLHRRLAALDPEAAQRIHKNDLRRIIRALELVRRAGTQVSSLRSAHGFADRPYRALHLALDPGIKELDARIDARCAAMIEQGLLREVRDLLGRGFAPELRAFQAIGYRHMIPVAQGLNTLVGALAEMQRDTHRFARRQRTWLRGVPDAIWLPPDDEDALMRSVEAFLARRGAEQAIPNAP